MYCRFFAAISREIPPFEKKLRTRDGLTDGQIEMTGRLKKNQKLINQLPNTCSKLSLSEHKRSVVKEEQTLSKGTFSLPSKIHELLASFISQLNRFH